MAKETFALIGAAIWGSWLALGIFNLWRGDISRVTYGCCLAVALLHIGFYYWETYKFWKYREELDNLIREVSERLNGAD